jgi:hypothetical protein
MSTHPTTEQVPPAPADREANLYFDVSLGRWTLRHEPDKRALWIFDTQHPLEIWLGGQWIFGYIDVTFEGQTATDIFSADKGGFCGLRDSMRARVGRGWGWGE